MLEELTTPLVLLGFVLAAVVGVFAHNLAQSSLAYLLGDDTGRRSGQLSFNVRRQFNIYGVVTMLLSSYGYGWSEPVAMRERYWTRRTRVALALAVGPVTYLALCVVALAGEHAAISGGFGNATTILSAAAACFAGFFIVSLFPVPPLDLGRIILTLAPPTRGWQQARYQLEERNFGLIIALLVVLLPRLLTGLPSVVDELASPLLTHLYNLVS